MTEELADLQARYDTCKAAEDAARRDTTAAVNALNAKQREFDKMVDDLREAGAGNWESRRRMRHAGD